MFLFSKGFQPQNFIFVLIFYEKFSAATGENYFLR